MKNVVITGSTRGLGLAMAKEFLKVGCRVTLSGRGEALPPGVQTALAAYSGKYLYVPCNVQNKAEVQRLWDLSAARWGNIDLWINNAGRNTLRLPVWETDEAHTKNILETNLLGMIFGSQIAAQGMLKQGHGAIYSMEGLGSNNMIQANTILYGTTKHALTYFMKGLAKELATTPVIAGRLSPGMVLTDFILKTPDGETSTVLSDPGFIKIFNILADRPETVARYFIPRMLKNTKNNAQIIWLTRGKSALRFMSAKRRQGRLIR